MTEYLIQPGELTVGEGEDQEEVSRTDEVVESLRESVQGRFSYWYTDGSFDYIPATDDDERLMIVLLDELDVLYERH